MTQTVQELKWEEKWASDDAGFGALQTALGCLPLKSLQVQASIAGLSARVLVRQTFRNSLSEPLEATYIFPLPDRGAVTSFTMRVGERRVEAELRERAEARAEYDRAIEEGHRAAIAEEERSGTFTVRVGNVPPGEDAAVELTLVVPLETTGAEATFRFPLVVAPRYVPGFPLDGPSVGTGTAVDTDQVPDASRVTPPVLLPGFPNPVRLSLEVEIDPAGLYTDDWLSRMACTLHSVVTEAGPPCRVRLQPGERLDRDFILRLPLASASVTSSLQVAPAQDDRPGTFALTLIPPALSQAAVRRPRDVVFVLDRSGSMAGWKMVAARRAVGRMIDTLLDHDRFTVVAFDSQLEFPDAETSHQQEAVLLAATNRGRWRTIEWLNGIEARGGTELGPALETAVCLLQVNQRPDREAILVLVTDGQVAGEDVLLRTLRQAAGPRPPRVFAVGIDQAVNAGFLRRLADLGGGWCELIESEDRLDEVMDRIHRSIATPWLTGIRLEPVGWTWDPDSLVPEPLPDLFAERPVVISGRFRSQQPPQALRLRIHAATPDGQPWSQEVTGRPADASILLPLWGRARVRALEDRYASGDYSRAGSNGEAWELEEQIVATSLETGVLSRFTAFVAVDRSEVVNADGRLVSVTQPVDLPAGWDADTPARDVAYCPSPLPHSLAPITSTLQASPPESARSVSELPDRWDRQSVVRRIRSLIRRVRKARRDSTRRRLWDELVDRLAELALLLSEHPRLRREVRRLQVLVERRLNDYDAGQLDALTDQTTDRLLDDILDAVDRVASLSRPSRRRRQRFWTL